MKWQHRVTSAVCRIRMSARAHFTVYPDSVILVNLSLSPCSPGHLHRGGPHGFAGAPYESHQRRLQKVQGKRPVQEAGRHAGGALPLTFTLTPSYLSLCEREEAAVELSVSPERVLIYFVHVVSGLSHSLVTVTCKDK